MTEKALTGGELRKKRKELEYEENKIPKEDLIILLNIDPKLGQKNVQIKNTPDIHEENLKHLEDANKIYLKLSGTEPNWVVVDCMQNGQMKSAERIHQEIIEIVSANIPS